MLAQLLRKGVVDTPTTKAASAITLEDHPVRRRRSSITPDLIGMGDSDKLPDSGPASYTFVEHRRDLDALLETLGVAQRVSFVMHDWGSALGFDWANRHRGAVKGLAHMEALVRPLTRDDLNPQARPIFEALRTAAVLNRTSDTA